MCAFKRGELPAKTDKDPTWRSAAVFTCEEVERLISDERIPEHAAGCVWMEKVANTAQGPQGPQGPTGPQGSQGPPGNGWYMSHSDLYCRTAVGANAANNWTLTAECDDARDLGLTGSCYGQGRADAYVADSHPFFTSTGQTAKWTCIWSFAGTPVDLPNATSQVCCILHR